MILTLDPLYIICCKTHFSDIVAKQMPPSVQNVSQTASLTLNDYYYCATYSIDH